MNKRASKRAPVKARKASRKRKASTRKISRDWKRFAPAIKRATKPILSKAMALDIAKQLGKSGKQSSGSDGCSKVLKAWNDTNPTGATTEVRYQIVDFVDSDDAANAAGQQYQVDLVNIPGIPIAGAPSHPVAKVKSCKLYVLPNFNLDPVNSSFVVLFGIPVLTSVQPPTVGAQLDFKYAAQKATLVTPTANMDWVLVGEWDDSIFHNSNIIPAESNRQGTVIAEWSLVNSDSFSVINKAAQFMIEYEIEQAMPQVTYFPSLYLPTPGNAWEGPLNDAAMQENAVWLKPVAITNSV